ncbi:MAG: TetR family transcriptional regulator C-terminal domain-containing protein, partial [Lachnospiraceae bacterium]|nr:TetR family transcriptional regulator C-terminal domain-containing protein [Lachnospiraceae bacterium]
FVTNLLESPRSDSFFEKMMTMFHNYVSNLTNTKVSFTGSKETFSYLIACTIGSTIGVLHKWIAEDFRTPADTVADLLAQVFITGILPNL